jgi:hypothetical protein
VANNLAKAVQLLTDNVAIKTVWLSAELNQQDNGSLALAFNLEVKQIENNCSNVK